MTIYIFANFQAAETKGEKNGAARQHCHVYIHGNGTFLDTTFYHAMPFSTCILSVLQIRISKDPNKGQEPDEVTWIHIQIGLLFFRKSSHKKVMKLATQEFLHVWVLIRVSEKQLRFLHLLSFGVQIGSRTKFRSKLAECTGTLSGYLNANPQQ